MALTLLAALLAAPPAIERVAVEVPAAHLRPGPGVARDPATGGLRLARSSLIADETGATDFRQGEPLAGRVLARKTLHLTGPMVDGELYWFGTAARVEVNGRPLAGVGPLVSTGWSRVRVPAGYLRPGDNEVTFAGPGDLLIEPGRGGRSARSADGGRTWAADRLGPDGDQSGEYVVRLRLDRGPERGTVTSAVLDLWPRDAAGVPRPGTVVALHGIPPARDTGATVELRSGRTPAPGPGWTDWEPVAAGTVLFDDDRVHHRFAQLRFDLNRAGPKPEPALPAVLPLAADVRPAALPPAGVASLTAAAVPVLPGGSLGFTYAPPSPRLKRLREHYRLGEVVAAGKTEMERLMLLRHWVRNQWHNAWEGGADAWMPPWDALVILADKDRPDCLTMCTHYAAVFTQCAQALGWNARHCILDHHCVSEVFVVEHAKWAMIDTGNTKARGDLTLHFERRGVPLSALELHLAARDRRTEDVTVQFVPPALMRAIAARCRPEPKSDATRPVRPDAIPLAELPKWPVCQFDQYRRYALPPRNTFLTSPFPGELCQGWSEYFHDGYLWVGDSPDGPKLSPEYSRHLDPALPLLTDEPIERVRLHLSATAAAGVLRVDADATATPNLARLERAEGDRWVPVSAGFEWRLADGENVLRVRPVNAWGRAGVVAEVRAVSTTALGRERLW
jgi:hypothetical protein